MGKKKGVKKGSVQAQSYLEEKQKQEERERTIWTAKVVAYTEQEMLDAFAITLHTNFGWGEKRLFDFHEGFEKTYAEIQELRKSDDDYDGWHSEQKIEDVLKEAWGRYYTPREERYDFHLSCPDGTVMKL